MADAEELAEWFIRCMTMEQRHKLMAERPVLYARAFPSVKPGEILTRVTDAVKEVRQ
jgi:hypothetical protein